MKRQLAITAAKWLAKRENREKVMHTVREFKDRMEREEGHADDTRGEHSEYRHDTTHRRK